jgi:hypothetical protein
MQSTHRLKTADHAFGSNPPHELNGEKVRSRDVTLIVGLANADVGFLVGETLLTPLVDIKGNPIGPVNGEFHGLKIQILNGENAIAFASSNAADVALQVTASVANALLKNPQNDVFEMTKEYYLASFSTTDEQPDCEFLVFKLG